MIVDFEINLYDVTAIVLDAYNYVIDFCNHIIFDIDDNYYSFGFILIALFFIEFLIDVLMSGEHPNVDK